MWRSRSAITLVIAIYLSTLTGCALDFLKMKNAGDVVKTIAAVAVVAIAAKVIYDLAIDYDSKEVANEDAVTEAYTKDGKELPEQPEVVRYNSSLKPGQVVTLGKPTSIVSELEVVRGKHSDEVHIEEKIEIYDNEDNTKVIKSLVKSVNGEHKKSGAFENEFKFTLPEGMPQGEYPIKTVIIINEQEYNTTDNTMQVVYEVQEDSHYQLAGL